MTIWLDWTTALELLNGKMDKTTCGQTGGHSQEVMDPEHLALVKERAIRRSVAQEVVTVHQLAQEMVKEMLHVPQQFVTDILVGDQACCLLLQQSLVLLSEEGNGIQKIVLMKNVSSVSTGTSNEVGILSKPIHAIKFF